MSSMTPNQLVIVDHRISGMPSLPTKTSRSAQVWEQYLTARLLPQSNNPPTRREAAPGEAQQDHGHAPKCLRSRRRFCEAMAQLGQPVQGPSSSNKNTQKQLGNKEGPER